MTDTDDHDAQDHQDDQAALAERLKEFGELLDAKDVPTQGRRAWFEDEIYEINPQ